MKWLATLPAEKQKKTDSKLSFFFLFSLGPAKWNAVVHIQHGFSVNVLREQCGEEGGGGGGGGGCYSKVCLLVIPI